MSNKWEITMQFGQEPGNQVRTFVVEADNEMQARKQAAKDWPVKGTIITKVKKLNAAYQNGVAKATEYINQRMGNSYFGSDADPHKEYHKKVQAEEEELVRVLKKHPDVKDVIKGYPFGIKVIFKDGSSETGTSGLWFARLGRGALRHDK